MWFSLFYHLPVCQSITLIYYFSKSTTIYLYNLLFNYQLQYSLHLFSPISFISCMSKRHFYQYYYKLQCSQSSLLLSISVYQQLFICTICYSIINRNIYFIVFCFFITVTFPLKRNTYLSLKPLNDYYLYLRFTI